MDDNALFADPFAEPADPLPQAPARGSLFSEPAQSEPLARTLTQPPTVAPAEAARILTLQMKTGLPAEVIGRHVDAIDQAAKARDFDAEKFRRETPYLAAWLTEAPQQASLRAALVWDDVEPLSAIERALRYGRNAGGALGAGLVDTSGIWGIVQAGAEVAQAARIGVTGARDFARNPLTSILRFQLWATGKGLPPEAPSDVATFAAGAAAIAAANAARVRGPQAGAGFTERAVYGGIESVGQMVPALILGYVAGPEALLGSFGVTTGGKTYTEARTQGVGVGNALLAGSIQGTVEGATEFIPAHRLLGDLAKKTPLLLTLARQMLAEIPGEQLATVLQDLNEWAFLPANKDRTFKDYLKERPSAAAATLISTIVATGLQTVGTHGTVRMLEQLGTSVQASKTAQHAPDALGDIIRQATTDNPVQYAPIDTWTTYWQSQGVDPAEAAITVLGSRTAYDEAVQLGTDLPIPTAAYAVKLANTEHQAFFLQELRGAPGQMNGREVTALVATVDRADAVEAVPSPAAQVRQQVEGFLVKGGMPASTAHTNAVLYEAALGTMAAKAGEDPLEVYQRYGLQIVRPDLAATDPATAAAQRDDTAPPAGTAGAGAPTAAPDRGQGGGGAPVVPGVTQGLGPEALDLAGGLERAGTVGTAGTGLAGAEGQTADDAAYDASIQDRIAAALAFSQTSPAALANRAAGGGVVDNIVETGDTTTESINGSPNVPLAEGQRPSPAGGDTGTGRGRRPVRRRADSVSRAADAYFPTVVTFSRAAGWRGTAAALRVHYDAAVESARSFLDDAVQLHAEHSGTALLKAIRSVGGLKPFEKDYVPGMPARKMRGELIVIQQNLEKYHGMRGAAGIFRNDGQELDGLLQDLQQVPGEWTEFGDDTGALWEAILHASGPESEIAPTASDLEHVLDGALHVRPGDVWWPDPATSFDVTEFRQSLFDSLLDVPETLPTGEQQPALPGTEGVRQTENATPQMAAPFSLTPETAQGATGQQTTLFQPLFHGSPHDVERFSLEHVGTGEGAASYGWGLYFAENPKVAADYHDRLAGQPQVKRMQIGSLVVGPMNDYDYTRNAHVSDLENIRASLAEDLLVDTLALLGVGAGGFRAHVLARLDRKIADYTTEWPAGVAAATALRAALAKPGALTIQFDAAPGGVYQVDIPDEQIAKMLDWDAPIKDQPAPVQQLVRETLKELKYLGPKDNGPRVLASAFKAYAVEHGGMTQGPTGELAYEIVVEAERLKLIAPIKDEWVQLRGKRDRFAATFGPGGVKAGLSAEERIRFEVLDKQWVQAGADAAKQASLKLAALGVPGLRYFDQGSRDTKAGTRNVVVFDDAIVTLTHKNGTPFTAKERREYFQRGPDAKRGSLTFGPDRQMTISLFAQANLSTFLHESGHFFLETFGDLVERILARDPATLTGDQRRMLADYGAIFRALGVTDRDQIGAEQHERFARMFEKYLMEGEAPSLELRPAFARFRAWLLDVYRFLRLNVPLSNEVRGVFDRMLASDAAIAEAEAAGEQVAMFTTAESAGMTPEQFNLYRLTIADASRTSREQLEQKVLGEIRREQTALWQAQRAAIEADVTATIHAQPVYRAIVAMQRGTLPDGSPLEDGLEPTPMKLDRAILVARYGKEFLKTLPRPYIYTAESGLDPDPLAELWGFSSGDELVRAVAAAVPMRQAIAQETDARMLEQHGSLLLDGTLQEQAQAAVLNEDRDLVVRAELRALSQLRRTVAPFVQQEQQQARTAAAEATAERAYERRWFEAEHKLQVAIAEGRKQVEIDALRGEVQNLRQKARSGAAIIRGALPAASVFQTAADARIAATLVRDINPLVYWSAARRASVAAREAAARQDFDAAITAAQQELYNLALHRAATAAREDVDARVKRARAYATPAGRARLGTAGFTYLDQVDGILDRYEFAPVSKKALERRANLRKFVAAQEGEGLSIDLPEVLLDETQRINYRELSYEALVGVTDGLEHLAHVARLKNRLLKQQAARELAAVTEPLADSIHEHNAPRRAVVEFDAKAERSHRVSALFGALAKVSTLAQMLDGYVSNGLMSRAVVQPLNAAADWQAARKGVEGAKYWAIVQAHYSPTEIAGWHRKVFVAAIGTSLSTRGRLAVALNWGTETGRDRLLHDPVRRWNQAQIEAILDTLDARDWAFVQATWDYNGTFRPEVGALEKQMKGVEPEWVDPLAIETKFGTFAGGYYPIAYDRRLARGAAQIEALQALDKMRADSYVSSTTRQGHLKARKARVTLPLKLDLAVEFAHIDQVIHDLAYRETLFDLGRILRDKGVAEAIYATHGDATYDQLTDVLKAAASGLADAANVWEQGATWMKTGGQISALGLNLWTAAQQPLGLFNGMAQIGVVHGGPKWIIKGAARWLGTPAHMQETVAWIVSVSPFMGNRFGNANQDISDVREAVLKPGGWFDAQVQELTRGKVSLRRMVDAYMYHIIQMQRVADVPTWLAGYEKAKADGLSDADAYVQGDQLVRDAQGSAQIHDLSRVQRGGPVARLFMMFYSYGNTVFNSTATIVGRTSFRSPSDLGVMVGDLGLLYAMPAFFTIMLSRALGKDPGDDDWADWLLAIGRESLATAMNTVVGLRELGGLARQSNRGYAGPAGTRLIQSVYETVGQVEQGELDHALWRSLNATLGIIFRYPSVQVQKTVDGAVALSEGTTHNPGALLVGPPPKGKH